MRTKQLKIDKLNVFVHPDRIAMGEAAAAEAGAILCAALAEKGSARIIVASAPSQNELLAGLTANPDIDWSRVTVFHMDEYVGLPAAHAATFRAYQHAHLLSKVSPAIFHEICGESPSPQDECDRYAGLLAAAPIDLVCLGIGENGHIAFNDPPVADFHDARLVKVVELDPACRQQQVNDGCFPDISSVPTHAITLTCPALMSAAHAVCVVPGPRKAEAVRNSLFAPEISTKIPATILRTHPRASLHLDQAAYHLSEKHS
jgi:glucosamine-6-phosphate deaminase